MKWFFFAFLIIIFIGTPFQKGLYFSTDLYGVSFVVTIVFTVFLVVTFLTKEWKSIKPLFFLFLLPLLHFIHLPIAVSPEGAWNEIIRWTTYVCFFVILYWVSLDLKIQKWLPIIFQLTGIVIGSFTFFAFLGWFNYSDIVVADRFAGIFQYPNTFGMVMALFYMFSLVNLLQAAKLKKSQVLLFAVPLVLFLFNFINSYSRGMFIVFPIVWFIGLLFFHLKKQIQYLTYTVISVIGTAVLYFVSANNINTTLLFISFLLVTTITTVGIYYFNQLFNKSTELPRAEHNLTSKRFGRFIMPGIILIFSLALILDLLNKGLIFQALPDQLQYRIDSISLSSGTASERIIFFEDALKMSADSPIIGFGGESWSTLYKNYQQTPYFSKTIHNGYLEWIVDIGWLGFLIYIGIFAFFFYFIFKKAIKEKDNFIYVATLLSLLIVVIHSFIDFNFTFGTVWFIIFWLICMGVGSPKWGINIKFKLKLKIVSVLPYIIGGLVGIFVLIVLVFSYRYMTAKQYYEQSLYARSMTERVELVEKAVNYHPTNIDYLSELVDCYHTLRKGGNLEASKQLENLAERLTELEPNNSHIINKSAVIYLRIGMTDKAIEHFNKALSLDPFDKVIYDNSIHIKSSNALKVSNNDAQKANQLAKSAIEDFENMVYWYSKFEKKKLGDAFNSREFEITPKAEYYAGLSYLILGDYESVLDIYEKHIEFHEEPDYRIETLAILAKNLNGQTEAADKIMNESRNDKKQIQDLLDQLSSQLNN